jgi:hypothetical protein
MTNSQIFSFTLGLLISVTAAGPLSVSVYAPLSRLCAMKPRMAMDCIAWSVTPTELW